MKLPRLLVAGGILLGVMFAAPAAQAAQAATPPSSDTISWSVVPASATAPDSRTIFSYTNIPPGATVTDHVAVYNRGSLSAAFQIYLTDATGTTARGALTLLPANTKSTDIGSWTSFANGANQVSVIIPGKHGIIEPFTIKVPSTATPGDHTGGMIAQVAVPHRTSTGQMVTLYQRVAVPVEMRVAGQLNAGLKVVNPTISFNNPLNPFGTGSAAVTYTVTNTGNVKMAAAQSIKVSGGIAGTDTINPATLPVILPGDSIQVTVKAPSLFPAGPIDAKVTVTPQWPAKSTPLNTTLTAFSGSTSTFAIPWATLVLLLLIFGGGYGAWRYLRWRRQSHLADLASVADQARKDTERRLLGKSELS
jgi:hypothetical protein